VGQPGLQAADLPARLLARVTLKGEVEQVQGPERDAVAGLHKHLHGDVSGLPTPHMRNHATSVALLTHRQLLQRSGAVLRSISRRLQAQQLVSQVTYGAAPGDNWRRRVQGVGVDAPQDSDLYYRLNIREAFYVGGLGAGAAAEVISAEALAAAEPDR
jgi:hypothetical protein